MTDESQPLADDARAVDVAATEAFSVLGNETRLAILLALWDAYEPFDESEPLAFSELYRAVDYDNPGNFSYHLEKVVGRFVRKSEDGYELRRAGHEIVRAVLAGAGFEEPAFDRTEIDMPCVHCGAPTAVVYRDEWIYQVCTECPGYFAPGEHHPRGFLNGMTLPPSGLVGRTANEAYGVAAFAAMQHLRSMLEGVCPNCTGPVVRDLAVCSDHDPADTVCAVCGRRDQVMARCRCTVCKDVHTTTPELAVSFHPAVVAFYHDHGIELFWEMTDIETVTDLWTRTLAHEVELVSDAPPAVHVTVSLDGDDLTLVLDDELGVTVEG